MTDKLDDVQLEVLRVQYKKIAVIDWEGHQLVFRRPTRDEIRDYWQRKDSTSEASNALDLYSQVTIAAFDGNTDRAACRIAYTDSFLEAVPAFTRSGKAAVAFAHLMGLVEEDASVDLGKGVRVLSAPPRSTPAGLPPGSPTSTVVRN